MESAEAVAIQTPVAAGLSMTFKNSVKLSAEEAHAKGDEIGYCCTSCA